MRLNELISAEGAGVGRVAISALRWRVAGVTRVRVWDCWDNWDRWDGSARHHFAASPHFAAVIRATVASHFAAVRRRVSPEVARKPESEGAEGA